MQNENRFFENVTTEDPLNSSKKLFSLYQLCTLECTLGLKGLTSKYSVWF